MPRGLTILAILAPLVAIILVSTSPPFNAVLLKVAARLQLPWPLAVHPDCQHPGCQIQMTPGHRSGDQQPFVAPLASDSGDSEALYTRRIVAVGDLHGDLGNARLVLQMAGVVDADGNWTGGVDYFVQTGDIIDRGDDTIELYAWMEKLREQAQATGGVMLSLLGNHEWMNVIGDWRYVPPTEIETFESAAARQKMLTTGSIGKSWAHNYTTAARLPLHPSLGPPNSDYDPSTSDKSASPLSHAALSFVHGGLAPTYPDLVPFPSRINNLGSSLLRKLQTRAVQPPPHPPAPYPGLPGATPAEERMYSADGPVWYRGWALEPEDKVCAEVDGVLEKTGTRRMIMGHTPDYQKIVSRCNGKIIIIDTGISHAYGGALSALSVTYTLSAVSPAEKRWKEHEVVTAVYMDRKEVLAVNEREVIGDFA